MANPISFNDMFDASKSSEVKLMIKTLENLKSIYEKAIEEVKQGKSTYAKSMNDMVNATKKLEQAMKKLNPTVEADQKQILQMSESIKSLKNNYVELRAKTVEMTNEEQRLTEQRSKALAKSKEALRLDKEIATLKARLKGLNTEEAKEVKRLREQITEKNREMKKEAQESLKMVDVYGKTTQRVRTLAREYKNLVLQGKANTLQAKKLKTEHDQLRASLLKSEQAVGQHHRSIGNYKTALMGAGGAARSLASAMGLVGGAFLAVQVVRNSIRLFSDFQKKQAELAGVLGTTREEIKLLQQDAIRLGGTTAKTAVEVTELQTAYARLGFEQEQILNLTGDTINGSIALNAELGETAELAGAVVRTFDQFGTNDVGEIMDVLTKSTQKSALNFDKLQTMLPIVGGSANAVGVEFNELVAMLGKLADAGIDASSAATAVRNIFIKTAAEGKTYKQGIDEVRLSQDRLTKANELFGVRGAVAATILASMTEETANLKKNLDDAAGSAEAVAEVQLDTFNGAIIQLNSAWEGFVLNIEDGDGKLATFIRNGVEGVTLLLQRMSQGSEFWVDFQGEAMNTFDTIETVFGKMDSLIESGNMDFTDTIKDRFEGLNESLDKLNDKQGESSETLRADLMRVKQQLREYSVVVQESVEDDEARFLILQQIAFAMDKVEGGIERQTAAEKEAAAAAHDRKQAEKQKALALQEKLAQEAEQIRQEKEAVRLEKERIENLGILEKLQEDLGSAQKAQAGAKTLADQIFSAEAIREIEEKIRVVKEKINRGLVGSTTVKGIVNFDGLAKDIEQEIITKVNPVIEKTPLRGFMKMQQGAQKLFKFLSKDWVFEVQNGVQNIQGIFQNLGQMVSMKAQQQLEALDDKEDQALSNAGENMDARAAIEEQFDLKRERIERKAAKRRRKLAVVEKAAAMVNITIDTARAVARTLAFVPYPLSVPLAAAAGALGATQLALVAATPIPAFAKGTKSSPEGVALVGERGREIVKEPSGRTYVTPDRPTLVDLPKGSEVLTNAITENILRNPNATIQRNEEQSKNISSSPLTNSMARRLLMDNQRGINKVVDRLDKSIGNQPLQILSIDENGVSRYTQTRSTRTKKLNAESTLGAEG